MKNYGSHLKKLYDNNDNPCIQQARVAMEEGDFDRARELFAEAIEQNSGSDFAWVGLALVHRAQSEHDLARACLLRGLDENPYNKFAIMNFYDWCYEDGASPNPNLINQYIKKYPEDVDVFKLGEQLR